MVRAVQNWNNTWNRVFFVFFLFFPIMVFHTEKSKQKFSCSRLGKIFPVLEREKFCLLFSCSRTFCFSCHSEKSIIFPTKTCIFSDFFLFWNNGKNFEQFYCPMEIIGTIRKMYVANNIPKVNKLRHVENKSWKGKKTSCSIFGQNVSGPKCGTGSLKYPKPERRFHCYFWGNQLF